MVRLGAQCLYLFLGLSLLLFAVPPASAQEVPSEAPSLFTGAGTTQTTMNDVGQKRLEALKQDSTTQSIRLVRLAGNLSQQRTLVMQANRAQGIAPTVHPMYERESTDRGREAERSSRKVQLVIQRDRVKSLGKGTYIWRGTVRGGPEKKEAVGDVTLYHGTGGDITGTIRISGEYYLIRPLNGGLHALVAEDESKYASGGDNPLQDGGESQGSSSPSTSTSTPLPSSETSSQPSCEASTMSLSPKETGPEKTPAQKSATAPCPQSGISVLAVYTSDAASNHPIDGIINTAIDEANQAFDNSNAGEVDLYLAHSQQVGFEEGTNIQNDLDALISDGNIQSLRDQHDADVIVLLTDAGYTLDGFADEVRAESGDAYAIVEASAATGGQFTFPHEIGHLQGAQHHPNDVTCSQGDPECDPEGHIFPDAYGHRFLVDCGSWPPWCTDDNYRTMMAYGNMTRVKHFSNPNVSYNGVSTGTSSQNNASALRTTVGTVKYFRGGSDLQPFIDVVSGDPPSDPDVSNYSFEADACGGSGGYSYEWRISYHGPDNFGNVLETGQTFSKNFPPGTHFVKLTVHSSDGQQDSATTLPITFDPYPSSSTTTTAKVNEESQTSKRKTVRRPEQPERLALRLAGPNPFEATTTLAYDLPERTSVELVVYDITGREVKRLATGSHRAGTYRIRLNGASLPSGVYVVRLTAKTKQKTQRITVVK